MADISTHGGVRGGFGTQEGRGGRGKGCGRGRGRGKEGDKEWIPVIILRRLVRDDKIKSLGGIYFAFLQIKEAKNINRFLGAKLKDQVLEIMPVQKKTPAYKLQGFVAIGDGDAHLGLGVKCSKEVGPANREAIIPAKLAIIPVRRDYWGNKIG